MTSNEKKTYLYYLKCHINILSLQNSILNILYQHPNTVSCVTTLDNTYARAISLGIHEGGFK
jgi:hypothetical protein